MQTFSHKPFIGLPLMFPGHLSCVELLLQKDIFLPPCLFVAYYDGDTILLHSGDKCFVVYKFTCLFDFSLQINNMILKTLLNSRKNFWTKLDKVVDLI